MDEHGASTVLVVDDSDLVLELFRLLLEDDGWNVHTRTTPFVDAQELAAMSPDVILLDLGIPGVQDRDLPYIVRTLRAGTARRILLHSGRSEDELRQLAGACGADGYLCKTGDDDETLETLSAHRPRPGMSP